MSTKRLLESCSVRNSSSNQTTSPFIYLTDIENVNEIEFDNYWKTVNIEGDSSIDYNTFLLNIANAIANILDGEVTEYSTDNTKQDIKSYKITAPNFNDGTSSFIIQHIQNDNIHNTKIVANPTNLLGDEWSSSQDNKSFYFESFSPAEYDYLYRSSDVEINCLITKDLIHISIKGNYNTINATLAIKEDDEVIGFFNSSISLSSTKKINQIAFYSSNAEGDCTLFQATDENNIRVKNLYNVYCGFPFSQFLPILGIMSANGKLYAYFSGNEFIASIDDYYSGFYFVTEVS